jgi:hypothetical protein
VAVFYRDDGQSMPAPGIKIGEIASGVEALNVRGPVEVKFHLDSASRLKK